MGIPISVPNPPNINIPNVCPPTLPLPLPWPHNINIPDICPKPPTRTPPPNINIPNSAPGPLPPTILTYPMFVPKLPHPPHNINIPHIAISLYLSLRTCTPPPDINIPNVCAQPPGFNIPNLWLKPLPWHHNINIPYYLYLSINPPPHGPPVSIFPISGPSPLTPSDINISNDFPKTPPYLSPYLSK